MADPISRLAPFSSAPIPRFVAVTEGEEGSGKTKFALDFPKPLAYLNMDRGFESSSAAQQIDPDLVDKGDYLPDSLPAEDDPNKLMKQHQGLWEAIIADYNRALFQGRPVRRAGKPTGQTTPYRTVVVDTGTGLWKTQRLMRWGKIAGIIQQAYPDLYEEFRREVIRPAYRATCNVVLIHRLKDERENKGVDSKGKEISVKTGRMVMDGMRDMKYELACVLRHTRDLTLPIPDRYGLEIKKLAINPELEGQTFNGLDFETFAMLAYPEVPADYWTRVG